MALPQVLRIADQKPSLPRFWGISQGTSDLGGKHGKQCRTEYAPLLDPDLRLCHLLDADVGLHLGVLEITGT